MSARPIGIQVPQVSQQTSFQVAVRAVARRARLLDVSKGVCEFLRESEVRAQPPE